VRRTCAGLAFLCLGGCVTRTLVIDPAEVRRHLGAIRARGEVEVEDVEGRSVEVSLEDRADGASLRELAAGCPDVPPSPYRVHDTHERSCALAHMRALHLDRVDVGGSVALWSSALVVSALIGTVLTLP
jgi:hypothetical protein